MNIIDHCIELLRINGEELCITEEQWIELVASSPFTGEILSGPEGCTFLGKPIRIVEARVKE